MPNQALRQIRPRFFCEKRGSLTDRRAFDIANARYRRFGWRRWRSEGDHEAGDGPCGVFNPWDRSSSGPRARTRRCKLGRRFSRITRGSSLMAEARHIAIGSTQFPLHCPSVSPRKSTPIAAACLRAVFDSTIGKPHRAEHGFYFQIGAGQVIKGWDVRAAPPWLYRCPPTRYHALGGLR